jgi:hypothetical protein
MPELTLEGLAKRVEALEKKAGAGPVTDWRAVVGLFDDDPGFADVIAEGKAIREADREAARRGDPE